MVFPHPSNGFVRDLKLLLTQKPMVLGAIATLIGMVLLVLTLPTQNRQAEGSRDSSPLPLNDDSLTNLDDFSSLPKANGESSHEDALATHSELEDFLGLGNATLNADALPRSEDEPPQNTPSSLLNPADLANSASTDTSSEQNREGQNSVGRSPSIYEDLFSPVSSQDTASMAVTIPSLLLGSPPSAQQSRGHSFTAWENSAHAGRATLPPSLESPQSTITRQRTPSGYSLQDAISELSAEDRSSTPTMNHQSPQPLDTLQRLGTSQSNQENPSDLRQPASDAVQLQTSPLPGTTGYTLPQALQSPINPYTQQINPPFSRQVSGQVANPSLPNALTVPQGGASEPATLDFETFSTGVGNSGPTAPAIPSSPSGWTTPQNSFAAPQTQMPQNTRYSGGGRGGEVNTFSNP